MDNTLLRFDKTKKLLYLDAETQNLCLNGCANLPWQVALLNYKNKEITNRQNLYIKHPHELKVGQVVRILTHYDEKLISKVGLPPQKVCEILIKEINEADYIVGHNVLGFDFYIINSLFKKYGFPFLNFADKVIDTLMLAKGFKLGTPYNKSFNLLEYSYKMMNNRTKISSCTLGNLGKEFNIDHNYELLHDALVDLELNVKVFDKLKYMIEI